tara:strand:- start:256 stop:1314 length:1059 start_codon:yes stop_codon:yes gene_type:complete
LAKLFLLLNNLKAQLLLGFLFLFNFTGCDRKDPVVDFTGNTWGTTYSIRLVSGKSSNINRTLIQSGVDSIFISIDDQMSTYKINSEISLFNQMQKNAAINISPDFANVINRSIHLSELTSGSIDITIFPAVLVWRRGRNDRKYKDIWEPPTDLDIIMEMEKVGFDKLKLNGLTLVKIKRGQMIDVNSIAKGWGVDQLYKYLKSNGFTQFMVEIGGEVRTYGKNNRGKSWKIGIDRPKPGLRPGEDIYAIASLKDQAMATSGNYRNYFEYDGVKYSHIIDPRNGKPTQSNIASVTVIAPNCMDADALATALNVMDVKEGKELVESLDGIEAFWIMKEKGNLRSLATSGMPVDN